MDSSNMNGSNGALTKNQAPRLFNPFKLIIMESMLKFQSSTSSEELLDQFIYTLLEKESSENNKIQEFEEFIFENNIEL